MSDLKLSIIVISYNMDREIPRTLLSLSAKMQKHITSSEYEVILVDNGSKNPPQIPTEYNNMRLIEMDEPIASPVKAINRGLSEARGEIVGVMVDGARIASPGLLSWAIKSANVAARPVIASMGYHLGPKLQSLSAIDGYNQVVEDRLLSECGWEEDGYRLFDISVFAGSSSKGYFQPMGESNALFMSQGMWSELGGYVGNFLSPGGGLVNLDTYVRACKLKDAELIVILGEGTFHQIHGGISSNSSDSPWERFHDEYVEIRGMPFERPKNPPIFVGNVSSHSLPFLRLSANLVLNDSKASGSWLKRLMMRFISRFR
jgi:glycosyltransferase involved in cell wall biosynthesis